MTALHITTVETEKYTFSIFTLLLEVFQIFQNFQLLTPIYKLFCFQQLLTLLINLRMTGQIICLNFLVKFPLLNAFFNLRNFTVNITIFYSLFTYFE